MNKRGLIVENTTEYNFHESEATMSSWTYPN